MRSLHGIFFYLWIQSYYIHIIIASLFHSLHLFMQLFLYNVFITLFKRYLDIPIFATAVILVIICIVSILLNHIIISLIHFIVNSSHFEAFLCNFHELICHPPFFPVKYVYWKYCLRMVLRLKMTYGINFR